MSYVFAYTDCHEPPLLPARILGQDDWLIYGRTADGTLVWTCIELDPYWEDAPHKGQCWDEATGRNCCGDTMLTCRIDNSFMLAYVTAHDRDYCWQECGHDTDGTSLAWPESGDEAFTAASRRTYLCA